jgi:hypothetical protein
VVEAKEIGEIAVLTIDVGVVRIVEGCFVVGREEGNALRDHFFQCGATATVNVFVEHIVVDLFVVVHCLVTKPAKLSKPLFRVVGSTPTGCFSAATRLWSRTDFR